MMAQAREKLLSELTDICTPCGALIHQAYDAARNHAARSKGPFVKEVESKDGMKMLM